MEALDKLIAKYEELMSAAFNGGYRTNYVCYRNIVTDLKAIKKQPFADIVTKLQNSKPEDNY
jgi:hypothetical protein